MDNDFVSEDDLNTFEGWLRYQGIDPNSAPEYLAQYRAMYDDAIKNRSPALGPVTPRSLPGEYLYAVAVRDRGLWQVLWVRRAVDEVFAMMPRGDRKADVHASYHRTGNVHMKANDRKGVVRKLQPLDSSFRGTAHLGAFGGYGPKKVGAICDPAAFHGVLELPPGLLGPRDGSVIVDLVEPNCQPPTSPKAPVSRQASSSQSQVSFSCLIRRTIPMPNHGRYFPARQSSAEPVEGMAQSIFKYCARHAAIGELAFGGAGRVEAASWRNATALQRANKHQTNKHSAAVFVRSRFGVLIISSC